jgi:hypothetical protein
MSHKIHLPFSHFRKDEKEVKSKKILPMLHYIDGHKETVEIGTTLGDILRSYPTAYLIELSAESAVERGILTQTTRTQRQPQFALQPGAHYFIKIPESKSSIM